MSIYILDFTSREFWYKTKYFEDYYNAYSKSNSKVFFDFKEFPSPLYSMVSQSKFYGWLPVIFFLIDSSHQIIKSIKIF